MPSGTIYVLLADINVSVVLCEVNNEKVRPCPHYGVNLAFLGWSYIFLVKSGTTLHLLFVVNLTKKLYLHVRYVQLKEYFFDRLF